ncbi:MAG: hypothetical protein SNJ75_01785, partial [Gemmataceae bacterium]
MGPRELVRLLDQQWWCWGRDLCHPEGNLFLRLGMCRYRPQLRPHDGTLYTARLDDHSAVYLWGFGGYLVSESLGG